MRYLITGGAGFIRFHLTRSSDRPRRRRAGDGRRLSDRLAAQRRAPGRRPPGSSSCAERSWTTLGWWSSWRTSTSSSTSPPPWGQSSSSNARSSRSSRTSGGTEIVLDAAASSDGRSWSPRLPRSTGRSVRAVARGRRPDPGIDLQAAVVVQHGEGGRRDPGARLGRNEAGVPTHRGAVVQLRPDPRQTGEWGMVVPRFVRQALTGADVCVYGDGERTATVVLHVLDTGAGARDAALITPDAVGDVFQRRSSDRDVAMNALAELCSSRSGSQLEGRAHPLRGGVRGGVRDVERRIPDIARSDVIVG